MNTVIASAALAATTMAASAGGLLIGEYKLGDHPDGAQNPPPYGLRLDNVMGPGVSTFSIGHHDDTILSVYDDGGVISINIKGTLFGGLTNNSGGYISADDYSIDFTYNLNVSDEGNGWEVNTFDTANAGTMVNLTTLDSTTLYGKDNAAGLVFSFLADGHRLSGDNSSWVGRGWVTNKSDGSAAGSGSQDWLFTATSIPAPGAFALFGLGGLIASRRRR